MIALGIAVVVLAVTGAVVVANGGDDDQTSAARPAQAVAEVSDIAVTPEALWITNTVRGTVLKLDKRTHRRLAPPIRVGQQPLDIAAGAGAVWVANYQSGTVTRIDPASNQLTGPIQTGRGPFGIDVGTRRGVGQQPGRAHGHPDRPADEQGLRPALRSWAAARAA